MRTACDSGGIEGEEAAGYARGSGLLDMASGVGWAFFA